MPPPNPCRPLQVQATLANTNWQGTQVKEQIEASPSAQADSPNTDSDSDRAIVIYRPGSISTGEIQFRFLATLVVQLVYRPK